MKFKIEKKKNKMKGGYVGMNFYAAKSHNIPFYHKHKNVIEIWETNKPVMKTTLKHEEIEALLMRHKINYHRAHSFALSHEEDKHKAKNIVEEILRRNK